MHIIFVKHGKQYMKNTEVLEGVHLEFLRKVAKLGKSTPRYMIYAEVGRHPLNIVIKQRMLNFWTRLLNGKISKFSYQIDFIC